MNVLTRLLKSLISPIAVGLYATLLISYSSFNFYVHKIEEFSDLSPFFQLLSTIDQKTIDFRLLTRGPREGSQDVALLTVDEKAVSTVGRWPWPREVIAKAYDNALAYGAKVIALDAVFSEPSAQPGRDVLEAVRANSPLSNQAVAMFESELAKRDSDKIFSEIIEKNSDRIVLGTFFESEEEIQATSAHVDRCNGMLFQTSRAYNIWNEEEEFPIINDQYLPYIPDILVEAYQSQFSRIEEEIRSQEQTPNSAQEYLEQNLRIHYEQLKFCDGFLDPEKDPLFEGITEAWPQIQEQAELEQETFAAWIEDFKASSAMNAFSIAKDWVMNIDSVSTSGKHTAYFNALQDNDGSIRRARLLVRSGSQYMPALALKAYLVGEKLAPEIELDYDPALQRKVVTKFGFISSETGDAHHSLPVDRFGNLTINYAGPQKMFAYISMADMLTNSKTMPIEKRVFEPSVGKWIEKEIKVSKADFLKDKILVFGATATAIYDLRVTPFDENFPGAETHVNIVDNLLRNDFLFVSPEEELQMPLFLLALGLVLTLLLTKLGAVSGILITAGLMITVIVVDQLYFFQQGLVISIMFPVFLIGGLYVTLTFYKYLTEERGKKELKQTFQKYVSPAVVDEILSDPENIELGGKKVNMTVFFSDVRGFTTISEKLDPRALSDLLNFYLTPMTELVFKNKGTLDKYMGDAVMAFFGAPIAYKDHAKHGCRCALQSLEKLSELQIELEKRNLPLIDIGIGLNTGEMSVGNMGSETVRSYTVMGDAVNLGSRLEGINKQYGTRIIISEFTYADVKDEFICREIDLVRVKGKIEPVKIYELVAEKRVPKEKADMLKKFEQGYDLYHQKEFQKGIEVFNEALSLEPDDACSKLYIKRCEEFIATPPPDDWDGVFVMTSK